MGEMINSARRRLARAVDVPVSDDREKVGISGSNALGIVADVIAVATVLFSVLSFLVSGSVEQAVLAVSLSLIALTFMSSNLLLERRFAREVRRQQATQHLVDCHHWLRDANVALTIGEMDVFVVQVAQAARHLSSYFSAATQRECRVTIQDVVAVSDDIEQAEVFTICRSEEAEPGTREHALPRTDRVGKNTDFLRILTGKTRVFFSNDLSKIRRYENSHIDVELPAEQWPYRSTIVWPVMGPSLTGLDEPHDIIGFLSLDSRDPGAFTRSLDAPTGKTIAGALYSPLSLYQAYRELQTDGTAEADD